MRLKLWTTTVAPDDVAAARELDPEVAQARLELARRQTTWVEIPQNRLVERGRFLVDAETDLVWMLRRGHIFDPEGATIVYIPADTRLGFVADDAGNLTFLEPEGRTWSEIVERKTRRQADQAAAAKARNEERRQALR